MSGWLQSLKVSPDFNRGKGLKSINSIATNTETISIATPTSNIAGWLPEYDS